MKVKHTRRATSRTERRPDGSEVVERSEEESYEEEDSPRRFSLRGHSLLGNPGVSSIRRLLRRISSAVGIFLLANRAKDFFSWLTDHVLG